MRIVLTGASGFIGNHLVSHLSSRGHELVLIGRDINKLKVKFPSHSSYDYSNLKLALHGAKVVIHLAAALPDQQLTEQEFAKFNVDLTRQVADESERANVEKLINFATLGWNKNAYSRTKKKAEEVLSEYKQLKIVNLRLPTVYAEQYGGRLSFLNRFPEYFRRTAFEILAAFRPTVRIDRILEATDKSLAGLGADEVIVSDRQQGNRFYHAFKLMIDYGFALTVLIFFWWLMVILYVLVRVTSRGPGIFAQSRIGRRGRTFTCYKFRTMHVGTRNAGTHEISKASVTAVGAFLRRSKLDELPQVFNILGGQLGLIGPRPCLPSQLDVMAARELMNVNESLPGITGLAQISGTDMSDPEKLARYDARYLLLRSIPLDLKILVATLLGRGAGDRTMV